MPCQTASAQLVTIVLALSAWLSLFKPTVADDPLLLPPAVIETLPPTAPGPEVPYGFLWQGFDAATQYDIYGHRRMAHATHRQHDQVITPKLFHFGHSGSSITAAPQCREHGGSCGVFSSLTGLVDCILGGSVDSKRRRVSPGCNGRGCDGGFLLHLPSTITRPPQSGGSPHDRKPRPPAGDLHDRPADRPPVPPREDLVPGTVDSASDSSRRQTNAAETDDSRTRSREQRTGPADGSPSDAATEVEPKPLVHSGRPTSGAPIDLPDGAEVELPENPLPQLQPPAPNDARPLEPVAAPAIDGGRTQRTNSVPPPPADDPPEPPANLLPPDNDLPLPVNAVPKLEDSLQPSGREDGQQRSSRRPMKQRTLDAVRRFIKT